MCLDGGLDEGVIRQIPDTGLGSMQSSNNKEIKEQAVRLYRTPCVLPSNTTKPAPILRSGYQFCFPVTDRRAHRSLFRHREYAQGP